MDRLHNLMNDSSSEESDESDDNLLLVSTLISCVKFRRPSEYRKRWDSEYLVNLAIRENSFKREYRMDPSAFDTLHEILYDKLNKNQDMARLAMSRTGSPAITIIT